MLLFPAQVGIAFAPGFLLLGFCLRRLNGRGARGVGLLTFLLGMGATPVAGLLEGVLLGGGEVEWWKMVLVVGPLEEVCKFGAVWGYAYRSRWFERPGDGPAYAGAGSVGFASLENLLYVGGHGLDVMLVRGPVTTVFHLATGVVWGWFLGRRRVAGARLGGPGVAVGVVLAGLLHGGFNGLVTVLGDWGMVPAGLMTVVLGWWAWGRLKGGDNSHPREG